MHLWAKSHLPPTGYDAFRELEEDVIDLAATAQMAELLPGRRVAGGLILPGAVGALAEQVAARNAFTAAEVAVDPGCAARCWSRRGWTPNTSAGRFAAWG